MRYFHSLLLLQGKGDGSGVSEHSGHIPQRTGKVKKLTPEQAAIKRKKIWANICKKEIPKAQKQKASLRKEIMTNLRKVSSVFHILYFVKSFSIPFC